MEGFFFSSQVHRHDLEFVMLYSKVSFFGCQNSTSFKKYIDTLGEADYFCLLSFYKISIFRVWEKNNIFVVEDKKMRREKRSSPLV